MLTEPFNNACVVSYSYLQSGSYEGGWTSQYRDQKSFLQIDLGNVAMVTGIVTQGNKRHVWWSKKYRLSYGNAEGNLKLYNQASK